MLQKGLADLVKKTGKELIEPTVKNVSLQILKQIAEEGSEGRDKLCFKCYCRKTDDR